MDIGCQSGWLPSWLISPLPHYSRWNRPNWQPVWKKSQVKIELKKRERKGSVTLCFSERCYSLPASHHKCNKVTQLCSTLEYHLVNSGMFTRRVDCQEVTTASRSSSIVYTSMVFKWRTLDMSLLCTSWICAHFLMSPKHSSFSKEYHKLDCIHPWFFQWKKCYMWWFALKRLIICQIKAL